MSRANHSEREGLGVDPHSPAGHWDRVYRSTQPERLGWYEATPERSLSLVKRCRLHPDDLILDAGAGASSLVASLLEQGFRNLIAVDLSETALRLSASAVELGMSHYVRWIVDDVTSPTSLDQIQGVRLWHDRAVLHFLTERSDRDAYRESMRSVLSDEAYVIIAAFSRRGARMCSGLPVVNYDADDLAAFLGRDFQLIEAFDYTYIMPSGDERPYVYTLFRAQ